MSATVLDAVLKRGLEVFEPKLLVIELSAVLVRCRPRGVVVNHVNEVMRYVNVNVVEMENCMKQPSV